MFTSYPPPKNLQPFVSFFYEIKWERKNYTNDIKEIILPSGLGFMVFQFSGRIYGEIANRQLFVPRCYTIGQQINTYTILSDNETVELTGVAFNATGLRKLLGVDMGFLVNNPFNTETILGIDLTNFSNKFENAATSEKRISFITDLLMDKVELAVQTCPMVDTALDMMYVSLGCIRMQEIIYKLNVSRRYLEKKFKEVTGITPAVLNRIIRFNNLFSEFDLNAVNDYARLSALFNYYDYSHFCKDFKKYCGESPSKFHIGRFSAIQEIFINDPLFLKYRSIT